MKKKIRRQKVKVEKRNFTLKVKPKIQDILAVITILGAYQYSLIPSTAILNHCSLVHAVYSSRVTVTIFDV